MVVNVGPSSSFRDDTATYHDKAPIRVEIGLLHNYPYVMRSIGVPLPPQFDWLWLVPPAFMWLYRQIDGRQS